MSTSPLLRCDLLVKKSPIHGYGVFANQDIKAGEIIEECYTLRIKKQEESEFYTNYLFNIHDSDFNGLSLGYGSIYNHSSEPSVKYEYDQERGLLIFTALRDIKPGEEILANYGENWFKSRNCEPKELSFRGKLKKLLPKLLMITRGVIVVGVCVGIVMVMR